MADAAYQNPTPPPAAGEGPGPFAFPEFLSGPTNPSSSGPAAPSRGGPPLRDQHVVAAPDPDVAAELQLLRQIRDVGMGSAANLVVTEFAPQTVTEVDHPVPGVKRWQLPRTPTGGQVEVEEGVFGYVARGDQARLGGSVVNSGTKAVVLALASPSNVNVLTGRIYLAAEGGAWDLRLAGITWAGAISAEARGGVSQLEVVLL
ncbi:MAG TPA: hypothetical protein VHU24_03140 [Solirubrobacterales bacterium]|jgi:hypothetical protein|nr:hypothetical protein [Solirubrobacterales bacterium]